MGGGVLTLVTFFVLNSLFVFVGEEGIDTGEESVVGVGGITFNFGALLGRVSLSERMMQVSGSVLAKGNSKGGIVSHLSLSTHDER